MANTFDKIKDFVDDVKDLYNDGKAKVKELKDQATTVVKGEDSSTTVISTNVNQDLNSRQLEIQRKREELKRNKELKLSSNHVRDTSSEHGTNTYSSVDEQCNAKKQMLENKKAELMAQRNARKHDN